MYSECANSSDALFPQKLHSFMAILVLPDQLTCCTGLRQIEYVTYNYNSVAIYNLLIIFITASMDLPCYG